MLDNKRIGAFGLLRRLGSGGMATTYLAEHMTSREIIVLKVAHPHLLEMAEYRAMFCHEGIVASMLTHQNLVRVFGLVEDETQLALKMEYVHGCTLATLMSMLGEDEQLDPTLVAWITIQVANGLWAAHQATDEGGRRLNIVHRDISPENILLAVDGSVKLTDFGVCRSGMRHTLGGVKGKLRYMAPEQARSEPVDHRADIYALGVVMWEMLTGRSRVQARTEAAMLSEILDPPPNPASGHVDISQELDSVVSLALQPDRSRRLRTAKAFGDFVAFACPLATSDHRSSVADLLDRFQVGQPAGPDQPAPRATAEVPTEESASPSSHSRRQRTATLIPAPMDTPSPASAPADSSQRSGAAPSSDSPSRSFPPLSEPAASSAARMPSNQSLLPVANEAARTGATKWSAASAAKLAHCVETLSEIGPRTTPSRFAGKDAEHAYYLNAFIDVTRMLVLPGGPTSRLRALDPDASHLVDGEIISLRRLDRRLAKWRDARQYVLLLDALLFDDDVAGRTRALDDRFERSICRLIETGSFVAVCPANDCMLIRASAWPFLSLFEELAAERGMRHSIGAFFAGLARGRLATSLEAAHDYPLVAAQPNQLRTCFQQSVHARL